jgi:uncharacterized membrane protein
MSTGFELATHSDFGAIPVRYNFRALPDSPDAQVSSTLRDVIGYIREDAKSPFLQSEAAKLHALGGGDPNVGLYRMLKRQIRFKRDEKIAENLAVDDPRKRDTIEVLIRPIDQWVLIKMRGLGIGDCDCIHMYGACLLYILGIPCSLVTVAADPAAPTEFSHVYLASYWNGVRTPLDISHGEYPGWECPNLGRIKEWPVEVTRMEILCGALLSIAILTGMYFGWKFFTEGL